MTTSPTAAVPLHVFVVLEWDEQSDTIVGIGDSLEAAIALGEEQLRETMGWHYPDEGVDWRPGRHDPDSWSPYRRGPRSPADLPDGTIACLHIDQIPVRTS